MKEQECQLKISQIVLALGLGSLLLLSGCADRAMKRKVEKSNFLGSYDDLKEDKKYKGTMIWIAPDADFKKFDSVLIVPIEINHGLTNEQKTPARMKLLEEVSTYLTEGYKREISEKTNLKIVDVAGPTTMKLASSISAVAVSHDDLKFYQFIPIALVATEIARATTSHPAVRIMGESKILDSQSNKVLLRGMSMQKGKEIKSDGKQLTFEDLKPGLDLWLSRAGERITDLQNRNPR